MKYYLCISIFTVLLFFGCSKDESTSVDEEKLYVKSIQFTTNISSTQFTVINTDTKKVISKNEDLKPTSQMPENGGIRFVYNETIKVKSGEKLRLILPYSTSRKYITVSASGGHFGSMASIIQIKYNMSILKWTINFTTKMIDLTSIIYKQALLINQFFS